MMTANNRYQNRLATQLRPVEIIRGFTQNAPGSVLVTFGNTKVLVTATIEERVPKHIYGKDKHGWLTAEYNMLPGATHTRNQRDRLKVSGRTMEIQRLIGRSLRTCVDLTTIGQRTITIDADVLQADGGTRVAAITGAYVALVDALYTIQHLEQKANPKLAVWPLPLKHSIAAVSVGVVNGQVLLDLDYSEDSVAEVDANVVMTNKGELIEVQATSEGAPYTQQTLTEMVSLAGLGIEQLFKLQQEALSTPPPYLAGL
jgi:ribonuclease PH